MPRTVVVLPVAAEVVPVAALPALHAAACVYVDATVPEKVALAAGAVIGPPSGAHWVLLTTDLTQVPEADEVVGAPRGTALLDAAAVMDRLRSPGGCPWDAEQTHESLLPYLVEECYELYQAIEDGDGAAVREELGDVLLQVLFHARVASEAEGEGASQRASEAEGEGASQRAPASEERTEPGSRPSSTASEERTEPGSRPSSTASEERTEPGSRSSSTAGEPFNVDDVAADLVAKLVGRHPHVFAGSDVRARERIDTAERQEHRWEELKRSEKQRDSSVDGVPLGQPAVALAAKLASRAARAGLPTDLLPAGPGVAERLFADVARAKLAGDDPEAALRAAARRFADEVRAAERSARAAGLDPHALDADAWRAHWPR